MGPVSAGGASATASRSSVRLRYGLGFAVAAATVTAAIALGCLTLLAATLGDALDIELDAREQSVALALEQERAFVVDALAVAEEDLRRIDPDSFERLLRGQPATGDLATRMAGRAGLDRLEVLDPRGVILASGPDRLGLTDPGLLDLPRESTRLSLERFDPTTAVALLAQAARPISVGSRSFTLVGAARLDGRILERIGTGRSALLLAGSGAPPRVVASVGDAELPELAAWVGRGGDRNEQLVGPEGRRWQARMHVLGNAGEAPLGFVVVACERTPLDRRLGRLRREFLLLGGAAALLAGLLGGYLAGRATRPLEELIRAVDAIGAGEADYTFAGAARDEFGELAGAFSRMHRSLALQRQRSLAVERVAAWSEVARHVAHEVKNPLVPIRLTVENLKRARERGHEEFDEMFEEGMRTIQEEVDQLTRLVGEFSEFARLPAPRRRATDLGPLLDAAIDLFAAEPGIDVARRYASDLPRVEIDPDQISRAFKNVIGNAVEAMRAGAAGPRKLDVEARLEVGAIAVVFSDSGPGLTAEAARRMFEPYFTTKPEGTGLGMAITYRILVEHGGSISAENRSEGGARVTIHLPRTAERSVAPQSGGAGRSEDGTT